MHVGAVEMSPNVSVKAYFMQSFLYDWFADVIREHPGIGFDHIVFLWVVGFCSDVVVLGRVPPCDSKLYLILFQFFALLLL